MKRSRERANAVALTTLALFAVIAGSVAAADDAKALREVGVAHYEAHYRDILREFAALLSIPNHASQPADIEKNLVALEHMLAKRGLQTRRLAVAGASPALYGETARRASRPTILFYAHYDGQPVGTGGWKTRPFEPILSRGADSAPLIDVLGSLDAVPDDAWRIYARSASDDKAPIVALLAALDALKEARAPLAVNLKVFLDGEEEVGSPHLTEIIAGNIDRLRADLLLFADGPRHQSGRPQVVLGVRGVQGAQLTLFGPTHALHSGHYGNWAPNPAARLTTLLASMRAADGRVLVAGFYDSVDKSLAAQGAVEDAALERKLRAELQLGERESAERSLAEAVAWPALNIVGLRSGDVGADARNAIPAEAAASLDFRLVPRQTPEGVRKVVEDHLRKAGYRVLSDRAAAESAPDRDRIALIEWGDSGYAGARVRDDAPPVHALIDVLRAIHGDDLVVTPILGGSLPLSLFADPMPKTAIVVLPIVNYDNNQHAANENVTLGSLRLGIATFTAILGAYAPPASVH